ncbi:hypothetical protein F4809DRAFT_132102 [Biscogniauxia mediterranea]|nr:hypothetical protein F4809DRAFT_132102 [Biscogniauxia mediterranea]
MAIIEIAYPKLKPEPEVIRKAEQEAIPVIVNAFKEVGVLNGLRGLIETQDGRDVSSDMRLVLVLEWPSRSVFDAFFESAAYKNFRGLLQPLSQGPPELKLYEASDASKFFSSDSVLEVLEIRPKPAVAQGDAVENILKAIHAAVEKNIDPKAVYGTTLNLDQKEVVVTRLFATQSELETEAAGASRRELLGNIGDLAEVTRLVAKVNRIPL